MKYVLRAWGQLKRGFEMLALGEICFEGMGTVQKGGFLFFFDTNSVRDCFIIQHWLPNGCQ